MVKQNRSYFYFQNFEKLKKLSTQMAKSNKKMCNLTKNILNKCDLIKLDPL